MAAWPTGLDVRAWMREQAVGNGPPGDAELLAELAVAATAMIRDRLDPDRLPVDPEVCPAGVRLAICIRAASLYTRRGSPHGMVRFDGDVVRINRWDADVDQLIAPYLMAMVG